MKNTSKNDSSKKNAAYNAAEYVEDGMVLGLGTGSTTHYFIEKVGMRIADEGIAVKGIPTSFQSLLLAKFRSSVLILIVSSSQFKKFCRPSQ